MSSKNVELVGPYRYVVANANQKPGVRAIVNGAQSLTFAQLAELSAQIGSEMRRRGLHRGQVAIVATGKPFYDYVFSLAVMHEGAIVAPQIGPKYVEALSADLAFSASSITGFPADKTILIDGRFMQSAQKGPTYAPNDYETENPVVRLFQTSGTTGEPKVLEYDFNSVAELAEACDFLTPGKTLSTFPMTIYSGAYRVFYGIKNGVTYYQSTKNIRADKQMMVAQNIESLITSPWMLLRMLEDKVLPDAMGNLLSVANVGAAMPKSLSEMLMKQSKAKLYNRYGTSECGASVFNEVEIDGDPSLVGKPFDYASVRVVDEDFRDLAPGEIGKIAVRTKFMRASYRNNPAASAKHFRDGFFMSGDEGYLSESGDLFLVGRSDERINSGGVKVDPALMDAEIWQIDGVSDAAVFGFDYDSGLRGYAAVIVLESSKTLDSVIDQVKRKLGVSAPQAFIEVSEVPKNQMGKVQRIDLENQYSESARELTRP